MRPNSIAVISRTFTGTPELKEELERHFSDIRWNPDQKLSGAELAAFVGGAEGAIVALEEITDDVLAACPHLKILSKFGVGLDNVDVEACKKRGVMVGWTGGLNSLSVAEMTLGFMLMLSRNLFTSALKLKGGAWEKNGGRDLSTRTVGIVGIGHVGKELIRLLKPFNCEILVNDIIEQRDYYASAGVTETTKEELFKRSDIVSLHVPLTAETRHMMNRGSFAQMKPGAFFVNTARGPLVESTALKEALKSETLAGAAVDVYDEEPPKDRELIGLPNLVCTPHIGGNSKEAVRAMGMSAIGHLVKHFN